ncbi:hypothetical protein B9Z55_019148 [Caenorhabditis nigoni]|uniref:MULE transposase domain-containing protein n=1 Tax=Caenorhabditis nigoni TaxID=1611254 RepID=A0A2G5TH95_9PELO|nr:hypothetical protein B9Z55_019148 [Caenorhabditis nigoni]
MKQGFTNSEILKKCVNMNDSSRLFFTDGNDLRNLRSSNNLHEGRFDEDDLKSVQERVLRSSEDDGICHFLASDEKGAGFCLVVMTPAQKELCQKYYHRGVCIDDTHNPTRYPLKLTTMHVVNGQDRGIPIAYMISSSVSSEDVAVLFQCVQKNVPDFYPRFLMSDEASVFWNGYLKVFPERQTKRIWCIWHVIKALGKKAEELLPKDSSELRRTRSWTDFKSSSSKRPSCRLFELRRYLLKR